MQELTALGTLSEMPGVVRCVGFGFTADKWPYIVMEHAGTPLSIMLSMPIFPVRYEPFTRWNRERASVVKKYQML